MVRYKRGSAAWKRAERNRTMRRRGEQIAFFSIVFVVIAAYFFLVIAR